MAEDDRQARELATALGSQYEVVRLLGRGGMGTVYLAREPFLDREVAVKVLPAELASGDARERFLREARTAARLSHPHIVPLHTFGQSGDLLFYVMGYVDGEPLEARLRRVGKLPPDAARRIIDELSDALDYAHRMGVVHRDVKPDNVLLDRHTGRAMLTDFGIAKQRAETRTLTQAGMVVGTPHYMSPEQAAGANDVDGRSDIYALGVIAYRMLTGQLPFQGDTMQQVLSQHAVAVPVAPSKTDQTIPLELDRVVMRALAKVPGDRWPTAAMIRQTLATDSDEALPEELRAIAGMGVRLALLAFAGAEIEFILNISGALPKPFPIAGLAITWLAVQAAGLLGWIVPVRRWGWRATLRHYFRQPSWWTTWWPKPLRRAGDVFDRLPRLARAMRNWGGVSVVYFPVFVNALMVGVRPSYMAQHPDALRWGALYIPMVGVALSLGPILWFGTKLGRWASEHQLSRTDASRLVSEPTFGSRFWSRPDIAALLADPESSSLAQGNVIAELDRIAKMEKASPHADVYRQALDAARQLQEAITATEEELAQLFRDANPAERERIKQSLDALGPTATGELVAKQHMRELLRQQLALFEQLDARKDEVRWRRDHLDEQLRALGLHVARLRAEEANAARAVTLTEHIRDVCSSLETRAAAIRETERVIART
jgi:predicted Ser/Thr protein kinase